MEKASTLRELGSFMRRRKRYWLAPLLVILSLVGILLLLGETPLGLFIYTLF